MKELKTKVAIMREIHVHIPAGLTDEQVVHIHLGAEPEQQPATSGMIETMLRRLETSPSASPHLRSTVAELQAMGYRLSLPKPHRTTGQLEKYIRVADPASPASAVAYMRPGYLIFSRPSDRGVLAALPGAIIRDARGGSGIKFAIDGQHELEAARKVKH